MPAFTAIGYWPLVRQIKRQKLQKNFAECSKNYKQKQVRLMQITKYTFQNKTKNKNKSSKKLQSKRNLRKNVLLKIQHYCKPFTWKCKSVGQTELRFYQSVAARVESFVGNERNKTGVSVQRYIYCIAN